MNNQWGCANRPAKEGFWAQDGWLTTESGQPYQPKFVWVPYRMSQGCGYDKIDEDARCAGCTRERAHGNVELTGLRRPYGEGPVERRVGGDAP